MSVVSMPSVMKMKSKQSLKIRTIQRGESRCFLLPPPLHWPRESVPMPVPLSVAEAAELTGYSLATVRRWADSAPMPLCAFRLLMLHAYGLMPWADDSWRGFRVRGDVIVTSDGAQLRARDLAGIRRALVQRAELLETVAELRRQVADLSRELSFSQIPLLRV